MRPGTTMSLEEFVALIRRDNPSTLGRLVIHTAQLRKSKRLPFRHEYVIIYFEYDEKLFVVRLDRSGNLGSLVKGIRWHIGMAGFGGGSKDTVRIELANTEGGQLLAEDAAGSNVLFNMQHWSSIIDGSIDPFYLWRAVRTTYRDIARESKLDSTDASFIPRVLDLCSHYLEFDPQTAIYNPAIPCPIWIEKRHPTIQKLLELTTSTIRRHFRHLSGQDINLNSVFDLTNIIQSPVQPGNHMSRFLALHSLTFHPLTLLDLAGRLSFLHKTWPTYNLATANCELFSRALCCYESYKGFSFGAHGYFVTRTIQREPSGWDNLTSLEIARYTTYTILALSFVAFLVLMLGANSTTQNKAGATFVILMLVMAICLLIRGALVYFTSSNFTCALAKENSFIGTPGSDWLALRRAVPRGLVRRLSFDGKPSLPLREKLRTTDSNIRRHGRRTRTKSL